MTLNELKSFKKILPAGAKLNYAGTGIEWTKRGGYADASLRATMAKAEAAGFVKVDYTPTGSPDGSVVGRRTLYRDPAGNTLEASHSYGSVAADNRFRFAIIFATPIPVADTSC